MIKNRNSDFDRRAGIDRRLHYDLDYFNSGGFERRMNERRSDVERRSEWIKISRYSSIFLIGADEISIMPAA